MNPTEILKLDHEKVKALFAEYRSAEGDVESCRHIADLVFMELEVHARIEEKLFYPVLKTVLPEGSAHLIDESLKEHETVKMLIEDLRALDVTDDEFEPAFSQLTAEVQHHME